MPRSNLARAPQLLSLRPRAREPQLLIPRATTTEARVPQLLKPVCLEPVLRNKRSHRSEKPAHCNEKPVHCNEKPAHRNEKPAHRNEDTMQPKINK